MTKYIFTITFAANQNLMRHSNYGRKSPRAKWHDYNGAEYFITICTKNMMHYFGKITNGEIQLTEVGEYLKHQIDNIHNHYSFADVLLYTIMPNHIHLIISIDGNKIPYDRQTTCRDVACRVQKHNDTITNKSLETVINKFQDADINKSKDATVNKSQDADINKSQDAASHVPTELDDKNKYMEYISNRQSWLSVCIGSFKSAVTKYANENNITFAWQSRYHDHIIRNQNEMNKIAQYIINNPAKWELDRYY